MALKKRDINYVVDDIRGENLHLLVDLKRDGVNSEPKLKEIANQPIKEQIKQLGKNNLKAITDSMPAGQSLKLLSNARESLDGPTEDRELRVLAENIGGLSFNVSGIPLKKYLKSNRGHVKHRVTIQAEIPSDRIEKRDKPINLTSGKYTFKDHPLQVTLVKRGSDIEYQIFSNYTDPEKINVVKRSKKEYRSIEFIPGEEDAMKILAAKLGKEASAHYCPMGQYHPLGGTELGRWEKIMNEHLRKIVKENIGCNAPPKDRKRLQKKYEKITMRNFVAEKPGYEVVNDIFPTKAAFGDDVKTDKDYEYKIGFFGSVLMDKTIIGATKEIFGVNTILLNQFAVNAINQLQEAKP